MKPFLIPDDFRQFMKSVVAYLETPTDALFLDAEEALDAECGYGGRIDGVDTYRFKYITVDGKYRWEIILKEAQIRDIADGLLIETDADPFEIVRTTRREPVGEPLMIWGEYADDALHVRSEGDLIAALETLHDGSMQRPRLVRVWTAADDQLVAAVWGDRCALYVVESPDGYATSMGDQTLNEAFEVLDHEGHKLTVPLADCVSWDYARRALVRFVEYSDLGDVPVEGRIPSLLLMMGDVDRKAALAARQDVPRELADSSLLRMLTPVAGELDPRGATTAPVTIDGPKDPFELARWARRLLDGLQQRALLELERDPNLDGICYEVGGLLGAHAIDAGHSVETADWLANEISAVRGIKQLFATGGDLQVAIRRSREA